MIAQIDIVAPETHEKAQYQKGVEWALAQIRQQRPDRKRDSLLAAIRAGAAFSLVRRRIESGDATDGPPEYRSARHVLDVAQKKYGFNKKLRSHYRGDSVSRDRAFWHGVFDTASAVVLWWNDHTDLWENHYQEVEDNLMDEFER